MSDNLYLNRMKVELKRTQERLALYEGILGKPLNDTDELEALRKDYKELEVEVKRLRLAMEDGQDYDGPDDVDYDAATLSEQCDRALEEKRD